MYTYCETTALKPKNFRFYVKPENWSKNAIVIEETTIVYDAERHEQQVKNKKIHFWLKARQYKITLNDFTSSLQYL